MFKFLRNLFSKSEPVVVEEQLPEENSEEKILSKEEMINLVDWSKFPDPEIINPDGRPIIMIVDDIDESVVLYNADFRNLKKKYDIDLNKDACVVKCLQPDAGFVTFKYLRNGGQVDYAVLDITLGMNIKLDTGDVLEIDGIDLALEILKLNPNAKILFCSSHTLNPKNQLMRTYIDKFNKATGKDIMDFYVNKNMDRMEKIYEMIKGDFNVPKDDHE